MNVSKHILQVLEQYAAGTCQTHGNACNECDTDNGCNWSSGECACHGDGYVC